VQLLSLAGIKHKSIVTFTHYANGLRSHTAHAPTVASTAATTAASAQGHNRRASPPASSTPRSSSPLPHASGPYAPGTSHTSIGGADQRRSHSSNPTLQPQPPPLGRTPRFEGGRLHQLSSSMEAMSGLTGGGNLSPGASVHAFEKQFSGNASAPTKTSNHGQGGNDQNEPPYGEEGSPRTSFLRPPPLSGSGYGGSTRGSPTSGGGGVVAGEPFIGGNVNHPNPPNPPPSLGGKLQAGLPGSGSGNGNSDLPFDVFADVTKSLNVLMLHAKKSCVNSSIFISFHPFRTRAFFFY